MKDFVMKNPKGTKGVFKMSNFFEKYSQIVGQDKIDKIIQEGKIIGQIKSRRMEIGLTQNDLAELIEVPKSTIGRIEAGLTSPRTDTLMKISRALNIPLIIDGRVQQLDKPSVEISLEYTIADAKIDNDNLSSSNDHFYSSFSDYSEPQRGQYVFENANKQNFDMEERQAKVA